MFSKLLPELLKLCIFKLNVSIYNDFPLVNWKEKVSRWVRVSCGSPFGCTKTLHFWDC